MDKILSYSSTPILKTIVLKDNQNEMVVFLHSLFQSVESIQWQN